MKLWLDDVRPAPEGWEHALDARAAVGLLDLAMRMGEVIEEVSLDHDLGANPSEGIYARGNAEECGCHVANYIGKNNVPILRPIRIHSWNPQGAKEMAGILNEFGFDVDISPYRVPTPFRR